MDMKEEHRPRAGEFYRHFKNKYYQVIGIAEHTETKEELVIYQALYGDFRIYARPLEMFLSEVDKEKYKDVTQKYRFELVEKISSQENENLVDDKREEEKKGEIIKERTVQNRLMDFLDANSYKEKWTVLQEIKKEREIDDKMINDIAVTLDVVIEEGVLEKRIEALEGCLKTLIKFECSRLR